MTTAITLFCGITAFLCLLVFVLKGLGIFKIAKDRNLSKPWLSFIPVANNYVLGSLAEKTEAKKAIAFKKLLPIFNIIALIMTAVFCAFSIFAISSVFESARLAIENGTDLTVSELKPFIFVLITCFLAFAAITVYKVFYYISLWRVYSSLDKQKAVMAIVLSVIFAFLVPVFLLVLKIEGFDGENELFEELE